MPRKPNKRQVRQVIKVTEETEKPKEEKIYRPTFLKQPISSDFMISENNNRP